MAQLFRLNEIPVRDLQALGLHDGRDYLLDGQTKDALLKGHLTKFQHLRDLNIDGAGKVSIDAKLSLRRKQDGTVGLYVHPIYKRPLAHPNLTPEEARTFAGGGVHVKPASSYGKLMDHGVAPYNFEIENKDSYYVRLRKSDGSELFIWGVDLERAIEESGHRIGDMVQLNFLGKEKVSVEVPLKDAKGEVIGSEFKLVDRNNWEVTDYDEQRKAEKVIIYEFDHETNSFVTVDDENVLVPDEINGTPLTARQKRDLKNGRSAVMDDGTEVKVSPKDGWQSNKRLLIASMVIDGGLSFAIYHAVKAISSLAGMRERRQEQGESTYTTAYRDALKKVLADLESKRSRYPNDQQIGKDIDIIKGEYARAVAVSPDVPVRNEADISTAKSRANDPELERNAEEREHRMREDDPQRTVPTVDLDDTGEEETLPTGRGR